MEEFEVNIDGSGNHKGPGGDAESTCWASPPPPAVADKSARKRNRARRRRSICIVLSLLVVCGIIAAIVVPTTLVSRSSVVAAVTDGSNGDNRTCNGFAANCYRRVNEIMYPTMHNAMATLEDQFPVAYNHLYSLEDALEMGFRAFLMDTCVCTGLGAQFCHASCAIGYRRPVPVFTDIVDFLNRNGNEIIILELQVGEDSFDPFYDKMLEVENLTSMMYHHPDRTAPWPIINDLIANNTVRCNARESLISACSLPLTSCDLLPSIQRLIIFQHDGPDCNAGLCPPGFHNTYEFIFETTWNATGVEGLMNFTETCVRTRGRKFSAFVLSNHFATNSLGLPQQDIAEQVNLAANIRNRTDACTEMLERQTNLLAVDFWSVGDTVAVVQEYNEALPDITESPSMSPIPSASPSSLPTRSPSPSAQPSAQPSTAAPTGEPTIVDGGIEPSPAPSSLSSGLEPSPEPVVPGEAISAPSGQVVDSPSAPTGTGTSQPVSTTLTSAPSLLSVQSLFPSIDSGETRGDDEASQMHTHVFFHNGLR